MFASFDVFKLDPSGRVLWEGFAENAAAAKAAIQKLMRTSPSDYLILDHTTGQRVVLHPSDGPAQKG
jgi:hypothetical protein